MLKYRGKVLVFGDDDRSFLSVIRSLGRNNICVHVGWCAHAKTALYSKYISKVHEIPPYSEKDDYWKETLIGICKREKFDLVIPCNDQSLIPLQINRKELEQNASIYLLNDLAFEIAFSKVKTNNLARHLGIPVPKEIKISSHGELEKVLQTIPFPVVLKPHASFTVSNILGKKNKVYKAYDSKNLGTYFEKLIKCGPVLAQENFVGKGVGLELLANDGEILFAFQHVRIHEPRLGGGSSYRKSIAIKPDYMNASRKLIKALHYTGVAMIEFKECDKTNKWVFIELNGRFWGSLPLALASGADFPFYLFQLLVEGKRDFHQDYRTGIYCRNNFNDFYWMLENFRSDRLVPNDLILSFREVVKELKNLLTFKERNDTLVIDDLKPGFYELRNLIAIIKGRVFVKAREKLLTINLIRMIYHKKLCSVLSEAKVVLFVCKGNICRSPFAQYYAQRIFPKGIKVLSAGYIPKKGRNCPEKAIEAASRYGLDLSKHHSVVVTEDLIREAQIVFTFDEDNLEFLYKHFPSYKSKIFRFSLLVNNGHLTIRDPYGGTIEDFKEVYSGIYRLLESCKLYSDHI